MSRCLAIATALAVSLAGCGLPSPSGDGGEEGQTVASALGGSADTAGYARALAPRRFGFPDDHGPHPDFRNEWWYLTGNLETAGGRRFGYQLTFFRIALGPDPVESESAWRTRQVYMAHFALSDLEAGRFHAEERFGRGAAGIAGAVNPPLRVWLDHWSLQARERSGFPLRLSAGDERTGIDLVVEPRKPVVLQGEQGLSRKSAEHGNASYYYSFTRLATRGRVRMAGERFEVTGSSWLDREWSTSALASDQVGWDWFALQLDDGRDLMVYRLRRKDGSMDPASAGTLVGIDGSAEKLSARQMRFEAVGYWRSPETGIRYPLRWRIAVPGRDLVLEVEPAMQAQELDLAVTYWEGAVRVSGREGDRPVRGRGYMELAGYAR